MADRIITVKEWAKKRNLTPGRAHQFIAEGRLPQAYQSPPEPRGTWLLPEAAEPLAPKRQP